MKRKKMGRPTRERSAATRSLSIRLTPREIAAWRATAGDVELSTWIRTICNAVAVRS